MILYKGNEIKKEGNLLNDYYDKKKLDNIDEYREYYQNFYQLKCGETLYSVCNKYGLDVQRVMTLNPRINPTRCYEGILIKIK